MSFSKKQKVMIGFLGTLLLLFAGFEGYIIIDQAVTITYMEDGYGKTKDELAAVVSIINTTDLSKNQIAKQLERYSPLEYLDFSGDTVQMYQYKLVFRNGRLLRIDNSN